MSVDFIPRPPRSLRKIPRSERRRNLHRLLARFPVIVKQALTPFDDRPTEPSPLPQDDVDIAPEQVEHCEWIFDQAEQRATSLEQKAQWTFGLIAFLAPLLAGSFVFLFKEPTEDAFYRRRGWLACKHTRPRPEKRKGRGGPRQDEGLALFRHRSRRYGDEYRRQPGKLPGARVVGKQSQVDLNRLAAA